MGSEQSEGPDPTRFRRSAILYAVLGVSAVFLWMIRSFLTPLFLAAVFCALSLPLYRFMVRRCRGRTAWAALATLSVLFLLVVLPLVGMLGLVATQATEVSQELRPRIEAQFSQSAARDYTIPEWLPFHDRISGADVAKKAGEVAGALGGVLLKSLSAASKGTAEFLLDLFIMLYAMFYFYQNGGALRERLLALAPLPRKARERLLDKGMSMARATIKGTVVIGLCQGALGGIAFAIAGITGAALWGTVMAVASVIPGLGTALVWVPAVVFLFLTGETGWGIGLTIWFITVVGTIDNVLRPKLVGGDTQMPDLLILVSTLGGLSLFGVAGLITGPVLAALFVGMWRVYEVAFEDLIADKT